MSAFVREQLIRDAATFPQSRAAWRASGEARWEHTQRVLMIAQEIARAEGADYEIVTVAGIWHDVGKFQIEGKEHAARSAVIAREYLSNAGFDVTWIERVCTVIANHNRRETDGFTLEDCILRDADILDETGALGIVWTCMNAARLGASSYAQARERIAQYDRRSNVEMVGEMLTRTGRAMAERRLAFVDAFIAQLDAEMGNVI